MTQHAPIELTDGEAASGQTDPEATDPRAHTASRRRTAPFNRTA